MRSSRRGFFGWLIGLPLAGIVPATQKSKSYQLAECYIAGFQYHDGPKLIETLHAADVLRLVAEPNNPHDAFAVRVERFGRHIGYLPRKENRQVSRLLTQSAPLRCRITAVDRHAEPWEAVRIAVTL